MRWPKTPIRAEKESDGRVSNSRSGDGGRAQPVKGGQIQRFEPEGKIRAANSRRTETPSLRRMCRGLSTGLIKKGVRNSRRRLPTVDEKGKPVLAVKAVDQDRMTANLAHAGEENQESPHKRRGQLDA